ncbi:hypothetical protein KAFR_0I00250 [Kazachstania africana CBS 2517]|uniref:Mto1-like Mto2p-binding domain-containing protein n=1 Tax=Kazachstania africana (strain ATCC 22294 / BCRC 22015 / CBS 2517 / CECT 1963 / NBRC 1671 / NRRL Y-8276) TaxID=1071382 RepID=H2AZK6_KAZAF|nr:hypothetical protein KAFR_0I00250 [Kazachstania africana CBS 2517]CCF59806.1 hypothetical protein KAFR_0I00250 [Kazachstania africana CBS 2517]
MKVSRKAREMHDSQLGKRDLATSFDQLKAPNLSIDHSMVSTPKKSRMDLHASAMESSPISLRYNKKPFSRDAGKENDAIGFGSFKNVSQSFEDLNDSNSGILQSECHQIRETSKLPADTQSLPNNSGEDTEGKLRNITEKLADLFENKNTNKNTSDDEPVIEGEDDDDLSTYEIPRLRESMTPWRKKSSNRQSIVSSQSTVISQPLFDNVTHPQTKADVNLGEFKNLQAQLTMYKVKVNALYEIIKQSNLSENNNEFFNNLLNTIQQDEEILGLKRNVQGLNNKLNARDEKIQDLNNQLIETRDEYTTTLNYTDEFLKNTDLMSTVLDNILDLLINRDMGLNSPMIKDLVKAKTSGSSFIMNKLNVLEKSLTYLFDKIQNKMSRSMDESYEADTERNRENTSQGVDSKMELVIEDLHQEYDKFIKGIRTKLSRSSELEQLLILKLSRQQDLLSDIASKYKENESDFNKLTLLKSYQEQSELLNNLIKSLKQSNKDKDNEIARITYKLNESESLKQDEIQQRNLIKELHDLKKLSKLKEQNWENLTNQLDVQINELTSTNKNFEDLVAQLKTDLNELKTSNEELLDQLDDNKKNYDTSMNQLNELKSNNALLEHLLLKQKAQQSRLSDVNEMDFKKFNNNIMIHLTNIFKILSKIIQKNSINQSLNKINSINNIASLKNITSMEAKYESLYTFIETAIESIIESYTRLVLSERDDITTNTSETKYDGMQLRIEELQRRWHAERERRKLDSESAEKRIAKLEMENELLKDQLFNASVGD